MEPTHLLTSRLLHPPPPPPHPPTPPTPPQPSSGVGICWLLYMQMSLYILGGMGASLTRHSWFEPISARRGLEKSAARLTIHGECNCLGSLPEYTLSLWGPWHEQEIYLPRFSQNFHIYSNVVCNTHRIYHKDARVYISRGDVERLLNYKDISWTYLKANVHVFTDSVC